MFGGALAFCRQPWVRGTCDRRQNPKRWVRADGDARLSPMRAAFADFEVDTPAYELRRGDEVIALEPQVFEVLAHLVRHHDRVVTKEELLDSIWGDRFVSESALTSRIK